MTTEVDAYVIEPEKKARRIKWWFVAVGVLIALMGVVCLAWPGLALLTVSIVVGVCFLASGVSAVGAFFGLGGFGPMSGWTLLEAVVDLILGVMFLVHPLIGGMTVAWLAGIFVVVAAVMDAVASWRARELTGTGAAVLGIVGAVISVVFGVLMMSYPRLFIIYLGCLAILRGLMLVIGAFTVSSLVKDVKREIGA